LRAPFHFFAGGPVGSGRQYMSWIHVDDWVEIVRWTLTTHAVQGPVNVTAPTPVTNAEFVRTLGRALGRPAVVPTPGFALRLVLGEMAMR
jgi:NAD dependent epimerase/dehydratase family enzyme